MTMKTNKQWHSSPKKKRMILICYAKKSCPAKTFFCCINACGAVSLRVIYELLHIIYRRGCEKNEKSRRKKLRGKKTLINLIGSEEKEKKIRFMIFHNFPAAFLAHPSLWCQLFVSVAIVILSIQYERKILKFLRV